MKKITLSSGKILEIQIAPFSTANALNKAIAKELKGVKLDLTQDLGNPELIKDLVCTAIASEEIMMAVMECMKRCTYNGHRINSEEVFEPEEARADFFPCCKEVIMENVRPFLKSLLSV